MKLASYFKTFLQDLKSGKATKVSRSTLVANIDLVRPPLAAKTPTQSSILEAQLLSIVAGDFLSRYDRDNKAMLKKLDTALAVFLELIGNKPVNEIFHKDINKYFDDVQQLPGRGNDAKFKNMTYREKIAANDGDYISEATYLYTYQKAASSLIQWAYLNYKDQGFPDLNTKGSIYCGTRSKGINMQRAIRPEELKKLFNHTKMKKYAENPETAHYCWLPLIGFYTGARINEVCQLNPAEDIKQDSATGIHYFHFTDEGGTAEGVDKSIKTNSSLRIVPIHSKLIELGYLSPNRYA